MRRTIMNLICPVCGDMLIFDAHTGKCKNNHSFDVAKSGYINLLLSSGHGKRHGDDRLMVRARTKLLDAGYYDNLSDLICDLADAYSPDTVRIIDSGCGEGKYTCDVLDRLTRSGKRVDILGIDISKDALVSAAKRSKDIQLCVASCAALPIKDASADMILSIFSPFLPEEFNRVLKPGGRLIRVIPLERHLWELKELIYDVPYENRPDSIEAVGFKILERRDIRYPIHLPDNETIMALFKMTPYYYKTSVKDQSKAEAAQSLDTTCEFGIIVYEKLT